MPKRSELRKDYIQEKYVIIAPRRGVRPHAGHVAQSEPVPEAVCALCPRRIDTEKAIDVAGAEKRWRIKVVKNRFPAVSLDNPKAYGVQEVVIETPEHNVQIEDLQEAAIDELIDIYARRTEALSLIPKIQYILIFKNNGGHAGASLSHAHSQVFATGFVPPHLLDKSEKAFEYRLRYGACPYCDVIMKEAKGPRAVWEDERLIAFTPYASTHNYELWILPKRHLDNVTALDGDERRSWAKILKKALFAIAKLGLPYNFYFHQVINDTDQHLYMKITPRGSIWAGVEIGSGIIINPVAPEDAAAYYRKTFA